MSVPNIYNFNNFQVSSITFNEPVRLEENNQYLARAQIKDSTNPNTNRLFFQTPVLKTKNSIQVGKDTAWIDIYLENEQEDFINFIHQIDEHNIKHTHLNSKNWFNQTFEPDVIEDFYVSTIRNFSPEEGDSTPPHTFIRINIPTHNDKPYINIYDQNKEYISYQRIKQNMQIIAIIEFKGLFFQKNKFICDINIVQLKAFVEKSKVNLTSYLSEIDEDSKAKEISKIDEKLQAEPKKSLPPLPPVKQIQKPTLIDGESNLSSSSVETSYAADQGLEMSETIPQFTEVNSDSESDDIPSVMPEEGKYNKDVIDDDMIQELARSKRKKHISRLSQKVEQLQKDALHTARELQRFSQDL
jgi:hypothetical protein